MSSKIRGLSRQSVRTMVGKKVVAFIPNEGLDVFIVDGKETLKSVSTGELRRIEETAFITASQKPFASALELARDGKEVDVFDAFRQRAVKNCKFVKEDGSVYLLSNDEDLFGTLIRDMQGFKYSWWLGQPDKKRFFVEKVHDTKEEVEETSKDFEKKWWLGDPEYLEETEETAEPVAKTEKPAKVEEPVAKTEKTRKSVKIELNKRFKGKYKAFRTGGFEDGMLVEEDKEIFLLTNNPVLNGCQCKDKKGYKFSWYFGCPDEGVAEKLLDFKGYLEDEPVKEESSLVLNKYCSLQVDLEDAGYLYLSDAMITRDSDGDYFVLSNNLIGYALDKEDKKGFKYSWWLGSTEEGAKRKLSNIEYFEVPAESTEEITLQAVMKELADIKEILNKHFK